MSATVEQSSSSSWPRGLRSDKLKRFFEENAGPVNEAQIVKDRISGRSKGLVSSYIFSDMVLLANLVFLESVMLNLKMKKLFRRHFNSLESHWQVFLSL